MLGHFSEETLLAYEALVRDKYGVSSSEESSYDFARCMRPDGSVYGSRGRCRKGTEVGAAEKPSESKLTKNEKIAVDVLSDNQFKSDRKRIAEMVRRGVSQDTDFIKLVADSRKKLGGKTTDTIRSLVKEQPKQKKTARKHVNNRDWAQLGLMEYEWGRSMRKGDEVDFYDKKTGDKTSGVVLRNDGKSVSIKENKDGMLAAGKVQRFELRRA